MIEPLKVPRFRGNDIAKHLIRWRNTHDKLKADDAVREFVTAVRRHAGTMWDPTNGARAVVEAAKAYWHAVIRDAGHGQVSGRIFVDAAYLLGSWRGEMTPGERQIFEADSSVHDMGKGKADFVQAFFAGQLESRPVTAIERVPTWGRERTAPSLEPMDILHKTAPHGEHDVRLAEDSTKPSERIYEIQDRHGRGVALLGSELASIASWWPSETRRQTQGNNRR